MFDDCIIMAGGSGTRLWPASNSLRPKQFLLINGGHTFLTILLIVLWLLLKKWMEELSLLVAMVI
jgi:mannose-1-phosphate guanylyltransferase